MFFLPELQHSGCFVSLQVPFPVLQGEGVEYLGHADEAIIAISNYRLHIKFKDSVINVRTNTQKSGNSRAQLAPVSLHCCGALQKSKGDNM